MALATPRSWVRFPGKARADKNVETVTWMQCKSLWIKASAKCINVNVKLHIHTLETSETYFTSCKREIDRSLFKNLDLLRHTFSMQTQNLTYANRLGWFHNTRQLPWNAYVCVYADNYPNLQTLDFSQMSFFSLPQPLLLCIVPLSKLHLSESKQRQRFGKRTIMFVLIYGMRRVCVDLLVYFEWFR